jgi:predicted nucleic acid-binding protein
LSKEEAKKFEVELFEIEILDLKGEIREKAMKAYRRLLKTIDKPIYLIRTDE